MPENKKGLDREGHDKDKHACANDERPSHARFVSTGRRIHQINRQQNEAELTNEHQRVWRAFHDGHRLPEKADLPQLGDRGVVDVRSEGEIQKEADRSQSADGEGQPLSTCAEIVVHKPDHRERDQPAEDIEALKGIVVFVRGLHTHHPKLASRHPCCGCGHQAKHQTCESDALPKPDKSMNRSQSE